jgi:hypothetical protein
MDGTRIWLQGKHRNADRRQLTLLVPNGNEQALNIRSDQFQERLFSSDTSAEL